MKERTIKDWIIATRPWSFPASMIPVIFTLGYLFSIEQPTSHFNWVSGWLSLPMLMLLHAGGNLVSDYYDHIKGIDRPGSLNGVRHIQSGKFQPITILHYGWGLLAAGSIIGIIILWRTWTAYHSMDIVWVGVAAIALPLLYPWMKGHALGDLDILLCFALLPAVGISYIVTGNYRWETMLYALTYGLLTVAILHANNTRDIQNDRRAGLHTLCGLIGGRISQYVYIAELTVPYLLVGFFVISGRWQPWTLLTLLTLPLAVRNMRMMMSARAEHEEDIPTLDKLSAQLQMAFGLMATVGFVITAWTAA